MVEYVKALLGQYLPEESEGQGLVEYALIIVLIAIVVIGAMQGLATSIGGVFDTIAGTLSGV